MEKESIAFACLLLAAAFLMVALISHNIGYGSRATTIERQCLLDGQFEARGTTFKCERV